MKVSRLKGGDSLNATDGQGNHYFLQIESAKLNSVTARVVEKKKIDQPPFTCSLAIPVSTGQKLDMIVEKGTELGIGKFILFESARAKSQSPPVKKIDRLERITAAAIKQSMRTRLPRIERVGTFESLMAVLKTYDLILFGDIGDSSRHVRSTIFEMKPKSTLIIVGPESGFTDDETSMLAESGAFGVRIGDHRLRMETAAISLSAIVIDSLFEAYNM